ncbi:SDR family NAD(P)-dependent oxidoreductase [Variovorax sp. dw_308]|uniref:SDR family NAD(P)-dependent oxidoreductase n=1 Tax=Variovorax sp. dw_308 TaxID=2721546 RepID=UPI001C43E1AA|nr:glucose 1-dehydrogenase [Variovorax sp. dw_308]
MQRLEGKVVMVFGAGSSGPGWGNGKAAAVAYAREGARVVAIDLDAAAVAETVAAIAFEGFQALAVTADVTDSASVVATVDKTLATHGRIDVLHNNVGVTTMGGPPDLDEAAWQRSLDINVGSVYRTTRAIIPQMQAQGSGVIINISSLASIRWSGYPYFAYYASKAAVNQATVAIALQYARDGIRANAILPGAIDTPLIYKQIAAQYKSVEEMREARNRAIPTGRMGTAWDIAYAAVFLASDEASFINGVCLPVDGGQSCSLGMPQ